MYLMENSALTPGSRQKNGCFRYGSEQISLAAFHKR
jgi:hypothetical protein